MTDDMKETIAELKYYNAVKKVIDKFDLGLEVEFSNHKYNHRMVDRRDIYIKIPYKHIDPDDNREEVDKTIIGTISYKTKYIEYKIKNVTGYDSLDDRTVFKLEEKPIVEILHRILSSYKVSKIYTKESTAHNNGIYRRTDEGVVLDNDERIHSLQINQDSYRHISDNNLESLTLDIDSMDNLNPERLQKYIDNFIHVRNTRKVYTDSLKLKEYLNKLEEEKENAFNYR
jgi:hypothetical protein